MATQSLYIGNLDRTFTTPMLEAAFAAFKPTNVRVVKNRGFGYVDVDEEQVDQTIRSMNGRRIGTQAISVSEAAETTTVAGIERNQGV